MLVSSNSEYVSCDGCRNAGSIQSVRIASGHEIVACALLHIRLILYLNKLSWQSESVVHHLVWNLLQYLKIFWPWERQQWVALKQKYCGKLYRGYRNSYCKCASPPQQCRSVKDFLPSRRGTLRGIKVKFALEQANKNQRRSRRIALLFL